MKITLNRGLVVLRQSARVIMVALAVVTLFGAFTPADVQAQATTVNAAQCRANGGVPVSIQIGGTNCVPKGDLIFELLKEVIRFLTIGVGLAATGGIIYGGILYAWAKDNASQTKQGVDVIRNSVIAILLYVGMYALLNFLIPGGIFQ